MQLHRMRSNRHANPPLTVVIRSIVVMLKKKQATFDTRICRHGPAPVPTC